MSIRQQILAETGNEIVADWYADVIKYFIEHLEGYHVENLETIEGMSTGFAEALNNVTEHGAEEYARDMDEAFQIFLFVIVHLPSLQAIPKHMLSITLARFFLENFFYLPPPPTFTFSPPSDTSSEAESMPSLEHSRSPSVDSGFSASSDLRINNEAEQRRDEDLP